MGELGPTETPAVELTRPCGGEMLRSVAVVAAAQCSAADAGIEAPQWFEARIGVLRGNLGVVYVLLKAQCVFSSDKELGMRRSSSYRGWSGRGHDAACTTDIDCMFSVLQWQRSCFPVLTPACQMACRLRCMGTKAAGPPWLSQKLSKCLQPVGPIAADSDPTTTAHTTLPRVALHRLMRHRC